MSLIQLLSAFCRCEEGGFRPTKQSRFGSGIESQGEIASTLAKAPESRNDIKRGGFGFPRNDTPLDRVWQVGVIPC